MRNKNLLLMLAMTSALISCQKEPDWEDMDNEYIVYTQRDEAFDVDAHQSYFVPDSILLIGDSEEAVYLKGSDAERVISSIVRNMDDAGYTRVKEKEDADLGIQLSYVSCTDYFISYISSPYWWWGYPGYWDPFYWGGYWGGWGYGFPITYSYSENSLLGEMVDLTSSKGENEKLPVVWNMYINGDISGYKRFDCNRMIRGIDRAFAQSAYFKKQD